MKNRNSFFGSIDQRLKVFGLGLLLVHFSSVSIAQSSIQSFPEQVNNHFLKEVVEGPQEKLYLQTDKPYYSAGEDLWFKGYLLNAVTHAPTALSQYIYVELINPCDSVCQRVKIRKDSLGFAGKLKLPPVLPFGHYQLRAYSYWMRNAGEDFFFKKDVYIGNPLDNEINSTITFSEPENGKMTATVRFTDNEKKPVTNKKIVSKLFRTGGKTLKSTGVTNSDGNVSFSIQPDTSSTNHTYLEVSLSEDDLSYKQKFRVPDQKDFDVQFFPEGGTLLANCLQTVAFKAIGSNGLAVDVTGNITDSKGEELAQIESKNKGMGKFILRAQPDQIYYAHLKTSNGIEKQFRIQPASTEGVIIQLSHNRGKIFYDITNQTKMDTKSLYLLIHTRGNVMTVKQLDSLSMSGQISESLFPSGVVTFSILNELTGQTLSERLAFIASPTTGHIKMETDKPAYNRREDVKLRFNLTDKNNVPVDGHFSLSITDSHTVIQDTLADNILSNILLTSDLKGYIEEPASYFQDTKNETIAKLDLLMLTQGWKRFNTSDVVNGKVSKPKYYLETGQALTGKVVNLFKKPAKNVDILMVTLADHSSTMFQTDSLGRYFIDGISFPDSTRFILKAHLKKSLSDVEILPDPDEFADVNTSIPRMENEESLSASMNDYYNQSKEKYFTEGGISVITLKEVTITSAKKKKAAGDNYYSGLADVSIGLETLAKSPSKSVWNMLYTISGVVVTGTRISLRGSNSMPLVLFNNMELTGGSSPEGQLVTQLKTTTADEVEDISVFLGASGAIFGMRGANGVIVITSRKGTTRVPNYRQVNLACIYPLGYQQPTEFYVPKYNVESNLKSEQPDLRTTIYWNPSLTTDKQGYLTTHFPTADKNNDYNVLLEGVSGNGDIYRYTGKIRRK